MDQNLDPFNGKYGRLLEIKEIGSKDYVTTEVSFTKREPLRATKDEATGWKWGPQRLLNEAHALQIVAEKTSIPVPKLFEHGYDDQGRYYVTMERIHGLSLSEAGKECQMVGAGVGHATSGPCNECRQTARHNADTFIREQVLPQLQQLSSNETGLNGFLLPPPRIVETREDRECWPVKKSGSKIYVLIHGDLASHNISINRSTLEVEHIYDWEHTAYLPAEMELELWCMEGREYYDLFKNDQLIESEISLITP
ncbi:uncharacterized protein MKZ38_005590 [Zalerion maritima]|uniref:Aminoglycoside phosphotransferase domain-containing protein n=1 Tax=Zalerion maritima TaxID=339359 RepID=A0AAD5WP74_9PEZI|nr:uncharacterized protein MKZ38_005590 [Zalerion maritima]